MVRIPSSSRRLPLAALAVIPFLSFACGGDTGVIAASVPAGLAILNSDFKAASVSLYDPATGAVREDCLRTNLDGGPTISGDVTLPSQPQMGGELVVIDRGDGVLSFVDPTSCAVRVQLSVATAFYANPRDVVRLSARKAYVTRYETNAAPSADPADLDEGSDVLIIDPEFTDPSRALLGRIPLGDRATTATVQARPDRAVLAGGKVYVSLGNISADFREAGPGRIVVIDPATDQVTDTIELPDHTGCSGMDYVAATKRLYVACGESTGSPTAVARSGVAQIDLSGASPVVTPAVAAAALEDGTQTMNFTIVAADRDVAFVGAIGALDFDSGAQLAPDAIYAVPLAGGAPAKLFEGAAYALGRAAIDAAGGKLLVPDGSATAPRVRLFTLSGGVATAAGQIDANPSGGLPPREVARY